MPVLRANRDAPRTTLEVQRGFTMIEMPTSLAAIGIVMAVAFSTCQRNQKEAIANFTAGRLADSIQDCDRAFAGWRRPTGPGLS